MAIFNGQKAELFTLPRQKYCSFLELKSESGTIVPMFLLLNPLIKLRSGAVMKVFSVIL